MVASHTSADTDENPQHKQFYRCIFTIKYILLVCAINGPHGVINMVNVAITAMYTLIYTLIMPLYTIYYLFFKYINNPIQTYVF